MLMQSLMYQTLVQQHHRFFIMEITPVSTTGGVCPTGVSTVFVAKSDEVNRTIIYNVLKYFILF